MDGLGPVCASTPADAAYARVLRLLTSHVAASSGLEFDRVEDVALATNEVFGSLLAVPGVEFVECAASCDAHAVEVTMSAHPAHPASGEQWPDELAQRVLHGVTEEVEYSRATGTVRFRIAQS